jgi:hypothetical protein
VITTLATLQNWMDFHFYFFGWILIFLNTALKLLGWYLASKE